jgi:hypothetical protein
VPISLRYQTASAEMALGALATNINVLEELTRVSQGDPLTIKFLVEALQKGELTPERLSGMPPRVVMPAIQL